MHPFQTSGRALQTELARIGQTVSPTGSLVALNARFGEIMRIVDALPELARNVELGRSEHLFELLNAKISTLPHAFDYGLLGLVTESDYEIASARLGAVAGLLSDLQFGQQPDRPKP